MSANLLMMGVSNAIVATGLAVVVLAVTRIWRHAPLAHALWLLVLVKLVTPPMIDLPAPILAEHIDTFAAELTRTAGQRVEKSSVDPTSLVALPDEANAIGSGSEEVPPRTSSIDMQSSMPNDSPKVAGLVSGKPAESSAVRTPRAARLLPRPTKEQTSFATVAPVWRRWSSTLLAVWAAGWFLVTAAALVRIIRCYRLIHRTEFAPSNLQEEVARVVRQTGVRVMPDVRVTTARIVPLIFSVGRRSAMLLPESLLPSLSNEERSTVLAHELAHLHRRDHWRMWFELMVVSLYWWHPVAWFARRQLHNAADECCDGWVIRWYPDRAMSYAESMLKSLDFIAEGVRPVSGLASGFGHFHSLKRRFEMVLNERTSFRMAPPLRIAAFAVAALLLAISPLLAPGAARRPETASQEHNKNRKQSTAKQESNSEPTNSEQTNAEQTSNNTNGEIFRFRGRVVSPDGKPVNGAKVFLYQWQQTESEQLAQSKEDGEFRFDVQPSSKLHTLMAEEGGMLVAVADGFGLAVKSAHECETTGALARGFQQRIASSGASAVTEALLKRILTNSPTFQLTKDDTPISGRVVDIQGQPVSGAAIRVCKISDAGRGGLDAWEKAAKAPNASRYSANRQIGLTVGNDVGGLVLKFIDPAKTDMNGRFTLTGIGRERLVKLLISGPDIETTEVFARSRKGDAIEIDKEPRNPALGKHLYHGAAFTHIAGPSQAVAGIVVDAKSKKPLPGVTIQSYQLAGRRMAGWTEGIVRTKTDEQGRFRLDGLPIGRNELLALSPLDQPYLVCKRRANTKSGRAPLKFNIKLTRGVWIRGRAFDTTTGRPIRSGRLGYYALMSNPHAQKVQGFNGGHLTTRYRLNPDGTYQIPGLPGRGVVAVMAERDHDKYQRGVGAEKIEGKDDRLDAYRTYPTILTSFNYHLLIGVNPAVDADSITVDFPLGSGKTLQVSVVDPKGKPVTGCQYTGKMEFNAWRQTNSDQLEVFGYRSEKPRRLQVIHQKRKLVGYLLIEGDPSKNLTLTLQPWAEIKGRIVDESGAPKSNVEINDIYKDARNLPAIAVLPPSEGWQIGKYFTDEEGRFHIAGLTPGRKFGLGVSEVREDGIHFYVGEVRPDAELKPGEIHELGDVEMSRNR